MKTLKFICFIFIFNISTIGIYYEISYSWPDTFRECTSCHTVDAGLESSNIYVSANGTDITSSAAFHAAPLSSIEFDFIFTNMAEGSNLGGAGTFVVLPSGWPKPSRGTSTFSPDFSASSGPSWSNAWDDSNAGGTYQGWCGKRTNCSSAISVNSIGMTGNGYLQSFDGTIWDTGADSAFDDGGTGDQDGYANVMGGDFIITAPGSMGNYTFSILGIGVDSSNSKIYIRKEITLTVIPGPSRIWGANPVYYSTLQAAYDDAVDGDIIQSQSITFDEDLYVDDAGNKAVSFQGGYNNDYTAITGVTSLSGNLTVSNGSISLEDFNLQ